MEADFQDDASSVLCTLRALEILEELGAHPLDLMPARAVDYLLASYVPDWRSWPLVPRHDNSAPHAPWWHRTDEFDESWGYFADNPRPSVVASLHAFGSNVDTGFLREVTGVVVERAGEVDPAAVQKDALECYIRFATTPAVPSAAPRGRAGAACPSGSRPRWSPTPPSGAATASSPSMSSTPPTRPSTPPSASTSTATSTTSSRRRARTAPGRPTGAGWARSPRPGSMPRSPWKGVLTVKRLRQLAAFGRVA